MKRSVVFLLLCLSLVLPIVVVQAHSEGTAQLIAADVENCQVSAWTWPDPLVTGQPAHVAVLLVEKAEAGATGDIILDSNVEITFAPQSEAEAPITTPATHELADVKFFYETEVELSETGIWDITIAVKDDVWGCDGSVGFAVPVVSGGVNWLLWGGVVVMVIALAAVGVWLWRRRQVA
jgi:hypothetical protein